jgi:hypothetical protein
MMKFFHFSDKLLEKKSLPRRALLWACWSGYKFLQVTQHCVATGAPMQEDVPDLNIHGKRVRMLLVLLSCEHRAGRGVWLCLVGVGLGGHRGTAVTS